MEELTLVVNGLAGEICRVHPEREWTLRHLKDAIQEVAHVPRLQQRLLAGCTELRGDALLLYGALGLESGLPASGEVSLSLVRRSPQQAEWLETAERDWCGLLSAPAAAWADPEVVAAAVARSGWALRSAAPKLRGEREVVLTAVRQNGLALQHAAQELARDPDVVLAAVAQCGRALAFAAEELRKDRSFVLRAVRHNGRALEYAAPELRADREVVLAAVEQCGLALAGAVTDLRADYDVVAAAIKQDREAIVFASSSLRAVPEIKSLLAESRTSSATDLQALAEETPAIEVADAAYFFGNGHSDGNLDMKRLLGSEGAMLCEMSNLGLPVAPGFCVTRTAKHGPVTPNSDMFKQALARLEEETGHVFGSASNPLLLSVHRAANLNGVQGEGQGNVANVGLNDAMLEALATQKTCSPHLLWDSYRRLILSFARIVKGLDTQPFETETAAIRKRLDAKCRLGRRHADCDIPTQDLKELVVTFKGLYLQQAGEPFPQDPHRQLVETLHALLGKGGEGERSAVAVVQTMVFGNCDAQSAAGIVLGRRADGGLLGEWLANAQAEDLREGPRPRSQLTKQASQEWAANLGIPEDERLLMYPSLEECMPAAYAQLLRCQDALASHVDGTQAIDFTVEQGKVWIGQPRFAKASDAGYTQTAEMNGCSTATDEGASQAKSPAATLPDATCDSGDARPAAASASAQHPASPRGVVTPAVLGGAAQGQPSARLHTGSESIEGPPFEGRRGEDASPGDVAEGFVDLHALLANRQLLTTGLAAIAPAAALAPLRPVQRRRQTREATLGPLAAAAAAAVRSPLWTSGLAWDLQEARLRLPLWQTALAGAAAGVASQIAAGNPGACARALPTGAVCCTFYVNFLSMAAGGGNPDDVAPHTRLACAAAAATIANTTTLSAVSLRTCFSGRLTSAALGAGGGFSRGLLAGLARAVPPTALDMCAIDVVRSAAADFGGHPAAAPGVLVVAGAMAGFLQQSLLYPMGVLTSSPAQSKPALPVEPISINGAVKALSAAGRARALRPLAHGLGEAYRRSVPAAAANSLVRVGLVSHFLAQSPVV